MSGHARLCPHPLSLFSHLAGFTPRGMESQGTRASSRVVPKAPESKSCGSKQAVALTKSLPAPGWGCRSWAWLGSRTGEDHLLRGDAGMPGASHCPVRGRMPGSRNGLDSSWGLEDNDKIDLSAALLGFLLPAGTVALPHLILVFPQEGLGPPGVWPPPLHSPTHHNIPVSPGPVEKPGCPWPCPAGAQESLHGLGVGMGSIPSCIPTPLQGPGLKDLPWLVDHITFVQLQRGLAIHRPLPPKFRLGPQFSACSPRVRRGGILLSPKADGGRRGARGVCAHTSHP